MEDLIVRSLEDTERQGSNDVLSAPLQTRIGDDLNGIILPLVCFGFCVGGLRWLPEDVGDGGVVENGVFGQPHVELVDESPHSGRHDDVLSGHVLESAVQDGGHQGEVIADVRAEVEQHGAEDGVGVLALLRPGVGELAQHQSQPFFFEEVEQGFGGQPLFGAMVEAVVPSGVHFGLEEELVAFVAQLAVDGLPQRRVEESVRAVLEQRPLRDHRFVVAEQGVLAR